MLPSDELDDAEVEILHDTIPSGRLIEPEFTAASTRQKCRVARDRARPLAWRGEKGSVCLCRLCRLRAGGGKGGCAATEPIPGTATLRRSPAPLPPSRFAAPEEPVLRDLSSRKIERERAGLWEERRRE